MRKVTIRTMAFSNLAFWHANRLETMTPEIIIDFITVLLHVFTTSDADCSRCIMLYYYLKTKRVRMRRYLVYISMYKYQKPKITSMSHYYVLWMCSDRLSCYLGNACDYCILVRVLLKCDTRMSLTEERWTKKQLLNWWPPLGWPFGGGRCWWLPVTMNRRRWVDGSW